MPESTEDDGWIWSCASCQAAPPRPNGATIAVEDRPVSAPPPTAVESLNPDKALFHLKKLRPAPKKLLAALPERSVSPTQASRDGFTLGIDELKDELNTLKRTACTADKPTGDTDGPGAAGDRHQSRDSDGKHLDWAQDPDSPTVNTDGVRLSLEPEAERQCNLPRNQILETLSPNGKLQDIIDEPEPENPDGEEAVQDCDVAAEFRKAVAASVATFALWAAGYCLGRLAMSGFEEPFCPEDELALAAISVCEVCGPDGIFLPLFGSYEQSWPPALRAVLYLSGLLWTFLGVGIVCDCFMAAIEAITSKEKTCWLEIRPGNKRKVRLRVWNSTIANLTLMALGSSAPEILLNVIEILKSEYFSGELGPSTIVGSASFNLLIIPAVCISSLPPGSIRKIALTDVYIVTATFSIFAYVWLLVVLQGTSPDKVDVLAFLADIGKLAWIFRRCKEEKKEDRLTIRTSTFAEQWSVGEDDGGEHRKAVAMSVSKVPSMHGEQSNLRKQSMSRANARKAAMRNLIGGKADANLALNKKERICVGFKETEVSVLECCEAVPLTIVSSREPGPGSSITVRYRTLEGTAKAGVRYQDIEGTVILTGSTIERPIWIPVIDDDVFQENEHFFVELELVETPAQSHVLQPRLELSRATVTILNDDIPGSLEFETPMVFAQEGTDVTLVVVRTMGNAGPIQCRYKTVADSAVANTDFEPAAGLLTFDDGQTHAEFSVKTLPRRVPLSQDASFKIVLFDPSPGVKLESQRTSNGAVCELTICDCQETGGRMDAMETLCERQAIIAHLKAWQEQFVAAMYCNGHPEEQAQAAASDWFFHVLCLPWKFVFAFVPPASVLGGWMCFWVALAAIGCVTAIIGDMASLLGCVVGIPDGITAITLVACGTSLPDTFASKMATQQDDTADNSIGNVTGSNSVNVFLGLGLPWSIAAVYWEMNGVTPAWRKRLHQGKSYEDLFLPVYPDGGFIVPAGALASSVLVFIVVAVTCLMILFLRRKAYGGELGGPKRGQARDSMFLVGLWVLYIGISVVTSGSA
eukprot:TRINITY_DN15310_c0_g1_i2.p1 TRINITY_DN15310_c0_g1~~TRINITY_DN15310_c0_g1_i2.p1  ORF type:complete len:1038 (+),score=176.85 TRINITY_DN15310_c0_g1_i2:161-3274(+)